MANIFQRSWNDLGNWLGSTEGQMLQMDPTGQVTGAPSGDFGIPQKMTPTGQVTGPPGRPAQQQPLPPEFNRTGWGTPVNPTVLPPAPGITPQPPLAGFSGRPVPPYEPPADVNLNAVRDVWNYLNVPRGGAGIATGFTQDNLPGDFGAGWGTPMNPSLPVAQNQPAAGQQLPPEFNRTGWGTPVNPTVLPPAPNQPQTAAANQPAVNQPAAAQPPANQPDVSQPTPATPATPATPTTPATPSKPVAVDQTVTHGDGSVSKYSHKSAAAQPQPKQGQGPSQQQGGQQGQPQVRRAYPVGVTPRAQLVAMPGQQQGWAQNQPQQAGQNVNVQVPAHPGLLQRIGQTIGHFFSGTLGQWAPQQGQQPQGQPAQPMTGSSALSGVHRALQSGRQHVMRHGPAAPASQGAPGAPFPYQSAPELGTFETGQNIPYRSSPTPELSNQPSTSVFPYAAAPDYLHPRTQPALTAPRPAGNQFDANVDPYIRTDPHFAGTDAAGTPIFKNEQGQFYYR